MLKKMYVVKQKEEFNDIIKKGKFIKDNNFVIYYKDNNKGFDRYGVTVGTKLGNAVFRNKYKRKIRAIMYQNMNVNNKGRDHIVMFRQNGSSLSFNELSESFKNLKNKLGGKTNEK